MCKSIDNHSVEKLKKRQLRIWDNLLIMDCIMYAMSHSFINSKTKKTTTLFNQLEGGETNT